MNPVILFAQGRFFNAEGLSHLGGEKTRASFSDSALEHFRRPGVVASLHRDSRSAQAASAKIGIRSQNYRVHFLCVHF